MKKFWAALAVAILLGSTALAAPAANDANDARVIPYPPGLDTVTEGASSTPNEINHPDSIYFRNNDYFTMTDTATLTIISHFPTYQQAREHTCGPAAGLMVLWYYGNHDYDEMSLARGMKTQPYPIGTNPRDMAKFFADIGWQVDGSMNHAPFNTYPEFQDFVLKNLHQKTPIMVENVEWGGHWRIIIGYDDMGTASPLDDVLIMADPYDTCDHKQDGYIVQNGEKFFSMWFDHSMLPKKQRTQPWLIVQPKA